MRASDHECCFEQTIDSHLDICLDARTLSDIVGMWDYEITSEGDEATLTNDSDNFKLKWIASSEYINFPMIEGDSFTFDRESFIHWCDMVDYCITEKNFSPVLTWMNLWTKNKQLIFCGTDSFRLAEMKFDIEFEDEVNCIIPVQHIQKIKAMLKETDVEDIEITLSNQMIQIVAWDITVSCLLIQWSFPDYQQEAIMPSYLPTQVTYNAVELQNAIKKANIYTSDMNNYIELEGTTLSAGKTDKWACVVELQTSKPLPFKVWVNWKYLREIKYFWDDLTLWFTDESKPIVYREGNYTYVIRPLVK